MAWQRGLPYGLRPAGGGQGQRPLRPGHREGARGSARPAGGRREENFSGRAGLEPGNLALVQLLATVPWVYNEAGALTGGSTGRPLTAAAQTAYAEGLLKGVVAAVPAPGSDVGAPSHAQIAQCIDDQRDS